MARPEWLKEIAERCEAATEGPWFTHRSVEEGMTVQCLSGWICVISAKGNDRTATFISHARADIPRLIRAVEILTKAVYALNDIVPFTRNPALISVAAADAVRRARQTIEHGPEVTA